MATRIQLRRDNSAEWTDENPTLASGEVGVELDTGQFKIGNGDDNWEDLSYSSGQPSILVDSAFYNNAPLTDVFWETFAGGTSVKVLLTSQDESSENGLYETNGSDTINLVALASSFSGGQVFYYGGVYEVTDDGLHQMYRAGYLVKREGVDYFDVLDYTAALDENVVLTGDYGNMGIDSWDGSTLRSALSSIDSFMGESGGVSSFTGALITITQEALNSGAWYYSGPDWEPEDNLELSGWSQGELIFIRHTMEGSPSKPSDFNWDVLEHDGIDTFVNISDEWFTENASSPELGSYPIKSLMLALDDFTSSTSLAVWLAVNSDGDHILIPLSDSITGGGGGGGGSGDVPFPPETGTYKLISTDGVVSWEIDA